MKKFFDKFHFLKLLRSPFIESRIKTDRMLLVKVTSTNTETGSFLIEIPFNGAVKSVSYSEFVFIVFPFLIRKHVLNLIFVAL